MNAGFVFFHPVSSRPCDIPSLGSTARVMELAISLDKLGVKTCIFSPYEKDYMISQGVHVRSIPNMVTRLGFRTLTYRMSRVAYYNKFFIRSFVLNKRVQKKMASNFASAIRQVMKGENIDVIQAEQDIAIMSCLELRETSKVPVVVDLHNLMSEELVSAGVIERDGHEFRVLNQMMEEMLSQVDSIIVVSEEMKKYVESVYGIPRKQIAIVPPGGRTRKQTVEEKHPPPKSIYAGLVSHREHVDLFVKSMPLISRKHKDMKFYITKKGEALKQIQKLAKRIHATPKFFWYPRKDGFFEFLASCHIGVLPSKNDAARKMGTPLKLFDYMSVGLPIVANDIGSWTNMITEEKIGLLSKDDPEDFARAIIELVNDQELMYACGRRAFELVKTKYTWENSAKTLLRQYRAVV